MHDLDGALNVGACGSIQSSTVSHDLVSHSVGICSVAPVRSPSALLSLRRLFAMEWFASCRCFLWEETVQ